MSRSDNRVKQSQYNIRFTLGEPTKLRQQGYHTDTSYISGSILYKIYKKIMNRLKKYKIRLLK